MQIIELLGSLYNTLLLGPTINLTILIFHLLESVKVPGALGFSIVSLTIIVSLITWPFRQIQLKSAKKMQETMAILRPKLDELKKQHKDNKLAYNQAQAELLKQHGVNPVAGCLPSLIPILLIYPIYQVVFAFFDNQGGLDKINYFLYSASWHLSQTPDLNFLGINLATKPSEFLNGQFFLIFIPLVTAGLTFAQAKMMAPPKPKHLKEDSLKETVEKEKIEDMSEAMQSQMAYMMPLMIGFFAFQFPVGLAIYWNTLTIVTTIQQYRISGWGGLSDFVRNLKSKI